MGMIERHWAQAQVTTLATPADFDERTLAALETVLSPDAIDALTHGDPVSSPSIGEPALTQAAAILAITGFVTVETPDWSNGGTCGAVSVLRPADGIPLSLLRDCLSTVNGQPIFEWLHTVVEAFGPTSTAPARQALELLPPQPTAECPSLAGPLDGPWADWVQVSRGLIEAAYPTSLTEPREVGLTH